MTAYKSPKDLPRSWLDLNLGAVLLGILSVALIAVTAVIAMYVCSFSSGTSNSQAIWGQFGDYIGGTLNPILSFFALMAVLITLYVQKNAIDISRRQAVQQTQVASFTAQISAIDTLIQSLNEQIEQYNTFISHGGGNPEAHKKLLDRRDTLLRKLDRVYEELVALETAS